MVEVLVGGKMKDNCPRCGVSLIGDPIPEEQQENYGGIGLPRFDAMMRRVDEEEHSE
jgi:hypothetical protein